MNAGAQLAIDFDAAADARDRGIRTSAEHANKAEPEWTGQALGMLTAYCSLFSAPFTMEEARAWCESRGLPQPPDKRAWGQVTKNAKGKHKPVMFPVLDHDGNPVMRRAASSNNSPKATYLPIRFINQRHP